MEKEKEGCISNIFHKFSSSFKWRGYNYKFGSYISNTGSNLGSYLFLCIMSLKNINCNLEKACQFHCITESEKKFYHNKIF